MSFIISHFSQIGLWLNFLGSLSLLKSTLFMTEEKAVDISSARWGPADKHFPAVKDRLTQRNWTIVGAILLGIGFIVQLL